MKLDTRFKMAMFSPVSLSRLFFAMLAGRRAGIGRVYQTIHLYLCDEIISLKGKKVLEVGGSLPESLVIGHYGCAKWVCVDDVSRYQTEMNWKTCATSRDEMDYAEGAAWAQFDGRIQDLPNAYEGKFDLVYSHAALEHVGEIDEALATMRSALAPGGMMYHAIGPIWSGPRGHHVFPTYFREHGEDAGARVKAKLRPWIHLSLTPAQMHEILKDDLGEPLATTAVQSIYESPRINRLTFDDYLRAFERAGLTVDWLHQWKKKQADTHFFDLARPSQDAQPFDVFSVVLAPAN